MYFFLAALLVLVVFVMAWVITSWWNWPKTDERGVRRFFGKVDKKLGIIKPGRPFFKPLIWGVDVVMFPTGTLRLSYKADESDEIRSEDMVRLYPEVTVYITLPFKEIDAMELMLQNDVPFNNLDAMQDRFEDVVMPAVQEAFKDVQSADVVKKKADVSKKVGELLRKDGGVFHTNGITGLIPSDNTLGHGWVSVQIESTGLPGHVSEAMEAPAIAIHKLAAAKLNADINAQDAGVVAKAYAEWLATPGGQAATEPLKKQMLEVIRQSKLAADGTYVERALELRGPNGEPLPAGLTYLSLGGGGLDVMTSGKRGKNPRRPSVDYARTMTGAQAVSAVLAVEEV